MYACHTREVMLEAVVPIPEHLYDDRRCLAAISAYIFASMRMTIFA